MLIYLCNKENMATTTPFAYNTGASIDGTSQVGDIAVGITDQDYSSSPGGIPWWMGPNEENGYVITVPVPDNSQPTQIPGTYASLKFYRTKTLTDNDFIGLSQYVASKNNTPQTFSSATEASVWLTNNGFWNSYIAPVLYLDAGNVASYPGTGTVWTDLIGGKQFNLFNGPGYDTGNGGKLYFSAPAQQYANCTTSLPSLSRWSVSAWHYYTGANVGSSPCIVSEVFPGNTYKINYIIGNGSDSNPNLQTGFYDSGWQLTPTGYALTPNNWYYIVGTYDGYNINLYVNDNLVETVSGIIDNPPSSNGGINLMQRWDNPEYWDGYLSTVGIYDKALSPSQISSIWNSTKSRYGL
jgi:hypothetical protein